MSIHPAWKPLVPLVAALALVVTGASAGLAVGGHETEYKGILAGAPYLVEIPRDWNGVLVLYSHGYVGPGRPSPAQDAPDEGTSGWLLAHGYAVAGSGYSQTGWAVRNGIASQLELLQAFRARFGRPRAVIVWGESMGGLITAALALNRSAGVAAALPMCGVLSGTTGFWDHALAVEYAFKTLLAPGSALRLVHISRPARNYSLAESILERAERTAAGRARLALVGALAGIPGWFRTGSPPPSVTDLEAWQAAQAAWESHPYLYFAFDLRAELEARAGGNPSGDAGVDLDATLASSAELPQVTALYAAAGLDLAGDLARLRTGARITPDPRAAIYASRYGDVRGDLTVPVLTMHTTGDGLVQPGSELSFVEGLTGGRDLVRQLYVARAGHCSFTAAESLAAFRVLAGRLRTGRWGDLAPGFLDESARGLGPGENELSWPQVPASPAFVRYAPAPLAGA
ncbi:MAG: alpha/beta hydrolase family protein [Candidatus Dormibacterales bacterium]